MPLRPQATKACAKKWISLIIEMRPRDLMLAWSLNHLRKNIYPLTTHDYSWVDIYYRVPT